MSGAELDLVGVLLDLLTSASHDVLFAQANPQTFKVSIPCMLLPYLGPLWRREQVPAPSSVVGFAKGCFPTSELTIPISMSNVILCFTILFHKRFMHLEPFLVTFIALTSLCIHTFDLVLGRAFFLLLLIN